MRTGYVSIHLGWHEVSCHDGTDVPLEFMDEAVAVAELFEVIRADLGNEPLVVISAYRTPAYNHRVGGAEKSYHLRAMALDLRPVTMAKLPALQKLLISNVHNPRYARLGGLGIYPHWAHVDTRPRQANGDIARWFGDGVGAEKV